MKPEYAVAVASLDRTSGFDRFTDTAGTRPAARSLIELVDIELQPGGSWLLEGRLYVEVQVAPGAAAKAASACRRAFPGCL